MYEQEQSEKKYIYYTCFIPLFLLLQYIALNCLSNYISFGQCVRLC